jgi:hypothetical protein
VENITPFCISRVESNGLYGTRPRAICTHFHNYSDPNRSLLLFVGWNPAFVQKLNDALDEVERSVNVTCDVFFCVFTHLKLKIADNLFI